MRLHAFVGLHLEVTRLVLGALDLWSCAAGIEDAEGDVRELLELS